MKKRWILIGIVFLVGAVVFWYFRRQGAAPEVETVAVSRSDIAETVSASATLSASLDIDLAFELSGRIQSIDVKEGEAVAAGETIATLQSVELEAQVEEARAALDRAEAEASANDEAVREAVASEKDAKSYLGTVEDLENQKVSAAERALDNAEDYEDDAKAYYDQVVSESGAGSATAKSAKLSLTAATNSRKAANESLETTKKSRDSTVRSAKNAWEAAREKTKTLTSSAQSAIETSAVRSAKASLEAALAGAEKARIKSPANGKVTQVNYSVGEVVGSSIGTAFGRLLSSDLLLEAKVPESDIARVRTGQTVDVSFDAFDSSEVLRAEVIEIEPDATVIQDVVYYMAKLRLSAPDARLMPGMSADADIHIAERKNALAIPARLLVEESDRKYTARVLRSDGSVESRSVSIGIRGDDAVVEILSGLSEGDRVVRGE